MAKKENTKKSSIYLIVAGIALIVVVMVFIIVALTRSNENIIDTDNDSSSVSSLSMSPESLNPNFEEAPQSPENLPSVPIPGEDQ